VRLPGRHSRLLNFAFSPSFRPPDGLALSFAGPFGHKLAGADTRVLVIDLTFAVFFLSEETSGAWKTYLGVFGRLFFSTSF